MVHINSEHRFIKYVFISLLFGIDHLKCVGKINSTYYCDKLQVNQVNVRYADDRIC